MDESLNIIAQQLGQQAASGMQNPVSTLTRRFGTVVAVGTMGTLDVQVANASGDNVLRGLQMTTACRGAAVGDRCIVETYAHISVVTGIIAHDNSDYVINEKLVVRQVDTASRRIVSGNGYNFSASAVREGSTPLGIVGVASIDNASCMDFSSFNMSESNTLWLQVIARDTVPSVAIRFYVLYLDD